MGISEHRNIVIVAIRREVAENSPSVTENSIWETVLPIDVHTWNTSFDWLSNFICYTITRQVGWGFLRGLCDFWCYSKGNSRTNLGQLSDQGSKSKGRRNRIVNLQGIRRVVRY